MISENASQIPRFSQPSRIPIVAVTQETEPALLRASHGEKFTEDKFVIVLEDGDGAIALEGTHQALEEQVAKLGLMVAELRETYLMDQVRKGRDRVIQGYGRGIV